MLQLMIFTWPLKLGQLQIQKTTFFPTKFRQKKGSRDISSPKDSSFQRSETETLLS